VFSLEREEVLGTVCGDYCGDGICFSSTSADLYQCSNKICSGPTYYPSLPCAPASDPIIPCCSQGSYATSCSDIQCAEGNLPTSNLYCCDPCDSSCQTCTPPACPSTQTPNENHCGIASTQFCSNPKNECGDSCPNSIRHCYPKGECTECTKTCPDNYRLEPTTCNPTGPINCEWRTRCSNERDNCQTTTYQCYPIGTCRDCNVVPPPGYHLPTPGEITLCPLGTARCNRYTECGVYCNEKTAPAYEDEPSVVPGSPTNPRITINGYTYFLSTSTHTRVRKPLPGTQPDNSVTIGASQPSLTPGTYRNPRYDFLVENYGLNEEWKDTVGNCYGVVGEDFCVVESTPDTVNFKGQAKVANQILKEGATGYFATRFTTSNKCDHGIKRSVYIEPKYKVDYLPLVETVEITGDPVVKGCNAGRYTGLQANNPLTITITGSDPDGVSDINGLSLWLVKRGVGDLSNDLNQVVPMGPGDTHTNPNEVGMFFPFLSGGQTHLYKAINENAQNRLIGWGRDVPSSGGDLDPKVQSSQGLIIESATAIYTKTGSTVEVVVTLQFPNPATPGSIVGEYDIYVGFSDIFTFSRKSSADGGGVYLDSQNVKHSGQESWHFDFIKPVYQNAKLERVAGEQKLLDLFWTINEEGSDLKHTVVNVTTAKTDADEIKRIQPTTIPEEDFVTPQDLEDNKIGNIPVDSGWLHPINRNKRQTSMRINTQDTSAGTLKFFITAFDNACNYARTGEDGNDGIDPINYDRWMSTKGGIFYSIGSVDYRTKLLDPNNHFYNLGSELLATGANAIRDVLRFTDRDKNPAVAVGVTDTNEENKVNLYEALKREANISMNKKLKLITPSSGQYICDAPEGCYYKPGVGEDVGGTYSGKILIYSKDDIKITDDLKATSNNDAMFIFSEKNIIVNDGHATGGTDRIDAFLLAKERITIAQDAAVTENHDQVLLVGGLIAFGIGGESPAFVLQRNLGADNPLKPALIINYHPKYTKFAELFFDVDKSVHKREVGFKPL